MLKKIMAAIAAALRVVATTVWVPMRVAGKLALVPLTVLEKVAGAIGGGGGAEISAEDAAAQQAAQQAQQAQQKAEQTLTAGDYSANLRYLARSRAEARNIQPAVWLRVPEPLAGYVKALSLAECEVVAKQDLKTVSAYLEGKLDRIEGVRTIEEAARDIRAQAESSPTPAAALKPTPDGVARLKASIAVSGDVQNPSGDDTRNPATPA